MDEILAYWSFVFLGVLVYSMGEGIKRVFPKITSRPWYQRTVVLQAPFWATAIAVIPGFPMPSSIGSTIGTRLLYGAVAGICASYLYKAFMRILGRDTKTGSDIGDVQAAAVAVSDRADAATKANTAVDTAIEVARVATEASAADSVAAEVK